MTANTTAGRVGNPSGSDDGVLPASSTQRAVWASERAFAGGAHSVHRVLSLRGDLDMVALRESIDWLANRHDVLRTTFRTGEEGPIQMVGPPAPAAFEVVDVRDLPAELRMAKAIRLSETEVAIPFDLLEGPLWRAMLITLGPREHVFVLTVHSIICDEWSCGILADELAGQYAERAGGAGRVHLAPAPQFVDVAVRQAARTSEHELTYWRTTLGRVPHVLELPTDHLRPRQSSCRGRTVRRVLPADLSTVFRELAVRSEVPLSEVLLATFAVVLGRYSGQDRFAVGWTASGRHQAENERVVGPLDTTVAVPVDLSANPTFVETLRRTHESMVGARDHQNAGLDEIVGELGSTGDVSRHPVFQVLVQVFDAAERWGLYGVEVERIDVESAATTVDLVLRATDGSSIEVALDYAVDLYDRASAERLLDALEHVLRQVTDDPATTVRDLSVVPESEWELVIRRWNDTTAPYPADMCLHELFEAQVARDPDLPAVVDADGTATSYRELNSRSNQLANHLRAYGVGPETFVGICLDHSVETLVGLLGIMKAGGAYVPLDPEHPADRLAYFLADTGANVVLTVEQLRAVLPMSFDGHVLCLDSDWARIAACPDTPPATGVTAGNLVYAMYTSGSTGRPKGVLITHSGLNNYLWWAIEGYGLPEGSGAPMVGSIAYDLSVPNFYLPLIGGKTVRLLPVEHRMMALSAVLAEPGDFSLLKITPGHLDVLRGLLANKRVTSVGTFVVGADEVRPETIAGWMRIAPDARIINEYGPTETVVGCSIYLAGDDFDPSVPVPIGRPIANIRMYVLDERLDPVPIGVTGELYIGGAGVARGYLGRPDLTAERFLPDPYAPEPGARIYRSGDLARRRVDGDIDFLGRIDHQVKINGYRVELGEIEARLLAYPKVSEAVVVTRPTPAGHKRLVAYLVPEPGETAATGFPGSEELAAWVSRTLPGHMVPSRFVVLDRMPLTQAGKVDRTALPDEGRLRPAPRD